MSIILEIIKEIEGLLWAVVLIVALFIVLKYFCMPWIQLKHERRMKADALEREKEWFFIKKTGLPLNELEKELKECKQKLEELQTKEKALNEGTESLQKEKEEFDKKVLNTKIKVYEEIFKTINK